MLLQKTATSTFSAVGCFLHFFLLANVNLTLLGSKNGQDISVGWAMLLMPPLSYMADHLSILSFWSLLNFSRYYMFPLQFGGIISVYWLLSFPYAWEKNNCDYVEIATIAFLDTGCLMLIFYCCLFGQKSKYRQGWAKFFDWGHCPHVPWLCGCSSVHIYFAP